MNSLLFLNIGHDISNLCAQLDITVNEARKGSALLKIILWPVHYILLLAKVVIGYIAKGSTQAYNHSLPETITNIRNHILSATPNSIYCFNKKGFLIFFADMYFMCFYFIFIAQHTHWFYIYMLCKLPTIVMPFLFLSPIERLPFWLLGFGLTALEICLGLWMIISWGYGINWERDHFYNHWKKCYRYRYASGNRQLTVELSSYIYFFSKVFILADYFCYNREVLDSRLVAPHTPTKGSVGFDPDSLAAWFTAGETIYGILLFVSLIVFYALYIFLDTSVTRQTSALQTPWSRDNTTLCVEDRIPEAIAGFVVGFLCCGLAGATGIAPQDCQKYFYFGFAAGAASVAGVRAIYNWSSVPAPKAPKAPTVPEVPPKAKGSLDFDHDYLTALLEQDSVANLRYGILFLLALSSLGVYSIILAGWSSNSKYAFIGALRSAAQMISYEVAISLIILPIVLLSGSLNLTMITYVQSITVWFLWPLLPVSILFLIAMLAETNRTPFDLPEAEAELVAGYNVDYSSLPFAMFFLGEYCNMILISTFYCILFLGGGLNSLALPSALLLSLKAAVTWIFFVLVRATLPRYRYDQLMDIGWKVFLPVAGAFLLCVFGLLVYFDALPVANELPLVDRYTSLFLTFFLHLRRIASERGIICLCPLKPSLVAMRRVTFHANF